MSRNIGDTSCHICYGDVVLCGEPHPILPIEAGWYFEEYEGMIVADAVCGTCDAKYLAWVKRKKWTRGCGDDRPFEDLSFRKSFNDEPAVEDLPSKEVLQKLHERRCYMEANRLRAEARHVADKLVAEANQLEQEAVAGVSFWECYRR